MAVHDVRARAQKRAGTSRALIEEKRKGDGGEATSKTLGAQVFA